MRRNLTPRSQQPDLLVRPPLRAGGPEPGATGAVDRVAALVELADLFARGLISQAQLAEQGAKVLGSEEPGPASATGSPSCAGRHRPLRRGNRPPACGRSS